MKAAPSALLQASRWRAAEWLFWLLALASPWLLTRHALIINEIAIVALFAVSLDLILGFAGVVSLGHAAFFGMGAYAAALFSIPVVNLALVFLDPLAKAAASAFALG